MADKIGIHDSDIHELKLGGSFAKDNSVAFHSIRYDFKPASVDTTRAANVSVGKGSSVTVEVPHVEGSGTSHTVFKGNKRPCQKECVLIIDHTTGEITLERLASDIRLKKTRVSNRVNRHLQTKTHNTETNSDAIKIGSCPAREVKSKTQMRIEKENLEQEENNPKMKKKGKSYCESKSCVSSVIALQRTTEEHRMDTTETTESEVKSETQLSMTTERENLEPEKPKKKKRRRKKKKKNKSSGGSESSISSSINAFHRTKKPRKRRKKSRPTPLAEPAAPSVDLVSFAKESKEQIQTFLTSHVDDASRRPQLRHNYWIEDLKRDHPEEHCKVTQRLMFSDDELCDLAAFLSFNYDKHLVSTRSITGEVQRLQDAMDHVITLYMAKKCP